MAEPKHLSAAWRRYTRAVCRAYGAEVRDMMPEEYEDAAWMILRTHADDVPSFGMFFDARCREGADDADGS